MSERHFIMADDTVVKIGHIHCAVWPELQIDGPKPGIVASEEIGLFFGDSGRAMILQSVAINPPSHDVPDKHVVLKFLRKILASVKYNLSDGCRAVTVRHHRGAKAKAVIRFPEAGIVAATQ